MKIRKIWGQARVVSPEYSDLRRRACSSQPRQRDLIDSESLSKGFGKLGVLLRAYRTETKTFRVEIAQMGSPGYKGWLNESEQKESERI